MKEQTTYSLIVGLTLTVAYLTPVHAVTDAELEALEKQIEQLEAEEKKKTETELKRQRQVEAEEKKKTETELKRQRQTEKNKYNFCSDMGNSEWYFEGKFIHRNGNSNVCTQGCKIKLGRSKRLPNPRGIGAHTVLVGNAEIRTNGKSLNWKYRCLYMGVILQEESHFRRSTGRRNAWRLSDFPPEYIFVWDREEEPAIKLNNRHSGQYRDQRNLYMKRVD